MTCSDSHNNAATSGAIFKQQSQVIKDAFYSEWKLLNFFDWKLNNFIGLYNYDNTQSE